MTRLLSEEQYAALQRFNSHARKVQFPPAPPGMPKGASKYKAQPCVIDGIRFASKAEGRRYGELNLLRVAGAIRFFVCHPKYPLIVNGVNVGNYIADFGYTDCRPTPPIEVVEDVKGVSTPVYKLKKRIVKAIYGFDIVEVK